MVQHGLVRYLIVHVTWKTIINVDILLRLCPLTFYFIFIFVVSDPIPSDIPPEEAWEKLLQADKLKDADDFREAVELYAKSAPEETFQSIEKKLRAANCNGRIVALVSVYYQYH